MSYGHGGGVPFPGHGSQSRDRYANPYASAYGPPAQYGDQMGMMPAAMQAAPRDPYATPKPGTIAYAKLQGPDGLDEYTPVIAQETIHNTPNGPVRGIQWVTATADQVAAAGLPSGATNAPAPVQFPQSGRIPPSTLPPPGAYAPPHPSDDAGDYPILLPGMTQREHDKAVKRWEKEQRRADEKRARKEEKERRREQRGRDADNWDRDSQDPYDIVSERGARPRRMSAGGVLGMEQRPRRMSGGAIMSDDLAQRLASLDTSFNTRRERRMSGAAYAPNAGGFRSRKNSIGDGIRDREINDEYSQSTRPSFYPPGGAGIPGGGGYVGPSGGGHGGHLPGGYGAGARSMPGSPVRSHSAFPPSTYHPEDDPRGGPSPRPGYYSRSRPASPSRGPSQLPGGYGASNYGGSTYGGGAHDPASASGYRSYAPERTRY